MATVPTDWENKLLVFFFAGEKASESIGKLHEVLVLSDPSLKQTGLYLNLLEDGGLNWSKSIAKHLLFSSKGVSSRLRSACNSAEEIVSLMIIILSRCLSPQLREGLREHIFLERHV
jgi:hypothetical protein